MDPAEQAAERAVTTALSDAELKAAEARIARAGAFAGRLRPNIGGDQDKLEISGHSPAEPTVEAERRLKRIDAQSTFEQRLTEARKSQIAVDDLSGGGTTKRRG